MLIIKKKKDYTWTPWKKEKAKNVVGSSIRIPTAIELDQPGVPLTNAELYFIGMMMTDGTWTNVQASISQSERHPEILQRIEKCLNDCGFLWTKTKIISQPPEYWTYC